MTKRWSDFREARGSYSAYIYLQNGKVVAEDANGNIIHISDDTGETFNEAVKEYPNGKIVFDAGEFPVWSSLKPDSLTNVIGAGREATVLKLEDGANTDVIVIDQKDYVQLIGFSIDGNKANNTSGHGIVIKGKTWKTMLVDIGVRNCKEDNIIFTSDVNDFNYEPALIDVESKMSDSNGITIGWTVDLCGWNVYCEKNGGCGVWCSGMSITIYHLHVYYNYGPAGVVFDEYTNQIKLVDPWIDANHKHGLIMKGNANRIDGGFVFNNGQSAYGEYSGIVLDGATYTIISHVYSTDFQETKTQLHGIEETGTADWNIITDNICVGNIDDSIPIVGSHTYCDQHIYTSLPTDGFIVKKPVIYYDGTYYYLAIWDGSSWRKVTLS